MPHQTALIDRDVEEAGADVLATLCLSLHHQPRRPGGVEAVVSVTLLRLVTRYVYLDTTTRLPAITRAQMPVQTSAQVLRRAPMLQP